MKDQYTRCHASENNLFFTIIDIRDEWQCRYWARRFSVRPKQLKRAIKVVGNRAVDVMRYLDVLHRGLTIEQKVDLLQMLFGGIFQKRSAPGGDAAPTRGLHEASPEAAPAGSECEPESK